MREQKKLRVVVVRATDQQKVLGTARMDDLPGFDRGEVVHSSNPRLPITDRTPKFLTVMTEWISPADKSVGFVEVSEAAPAFDHRKVPSVWHRGHRIDLSFYPGTGNMSQMMPVPAFWEVAVDEVIIGALNSDVTSLQKLGSEAVALADSFIERRILEKKSEF
jgi:hypothetical protein